MKYNKIATVICSAALSLLTLTGCEGGDLFSINAPDWLSSKADSIAAEKAKNQGDDVIEGMEEDVYTVGATDYSTGWWAQFSKYYQIPEGGKWIAQFNLNINPSASNTYKNFAMIITNDATIRSMVLSDTTISPVVTLSGVTISTVVWHRATWSLLPIPILVLIS